MYKFSPITFVPIFLLSAILLVACGKVTDGSEVDKITALEKLYRKEAEKAADPEAEINKDVYRDLLDAYIDFVAKYPEANEAPKFLHSAAILYNDTRGLDNKGKAVELYTRTYTEYPDHELAPLSMFMVGYIYANDLRDELKAEKIYKNFLTRYPEDKMAVSAKAELKNIGKTPAETLELLQKKKDEGTVPDSLGDS